MIEDRDPTYARQKIVGLVRRQGRVDHRAGDRATTRSGPIEPLTRSHGQTLSAKPCPGHACLPSPDPPCTRGRAGRGQQEKRGCPREDGVPAALRGGVSLRGHDDDGDVIRSYRNAREFEPILVGRY